VSDRDGDYAWEMQNARGNYASDTQRSYYDDRIDPQRNYNDSSRRALDKWHDDTPSPSKGGGSRPSSPSTSEGWPWEGGGASGNGSGPSWNNATDQPYLLKRVARSPVYMLSIPLCLAAFFLFQALLQQSNDAGNSKTCLFLAAACLMIAGYRAGDIYRTRRARTGSIYGCPVITPEQVIPPQGASHVQPNTTSMPTTGALIVSTSPGARPRTTQGNVHTPPTTIRP